jgi:hypothetical protein
MMRPAENWHCGNDANRLGTSEIRASLPNGKWSWPAPQFSAIHKQRPAVISPSWGRFSSPRHRELARRQGPETARRVLVEALIAKFAVERFDEGVLHRLTGFDVVALQLPYGAAQHRAAG